MPNASLKAEIERFGRLYVASSHVSRALIRSRTRQELLDQVVRILVDVGEFAMALIQWHEPSTHELVPVAKYGKGCDYATVAKVYADDRPEGHGPAGTAFRSGFPYVCNDFLNDPRTLLWREAAHTCRWRASAAFPISIEGSPQGLLAVYAFEPGTFGTEQVELLQRVTSDVAFGLEHLEKEEQRRQAQTALATSERRLTQAIDAAALGVWERDLVTDSVVWGGHTERIFGLDPGGFEGTVVGFERSVLPADLPALNRALETARDGRCPFAHEFRIVWPDGSKHWVLGRGEFSYSDSGQPLRMYGAVMDITERKSSEQALRDSEERFSQLAEQSATVTWEVDSEGRYTYVSLASLAVWGYGPEELVGRHFYDFHPVEGRDKFKKQTLALFERQEAPRNLEHAWQTKDGRTLWINTNGLPLLYADGTLRGYHGSDTDITERMLTAESLSKSAKEHRDILATAMDGFVRVDMQGRLLEVNEAYSRMSGYSMQELPTMHLSELQAVDRKEDIDARSRRLLEHNQDRFQSHHRRKDGSIFDVEVNCQYHPTDGGRIVAFIQDITARKRMECALLESEARERARAEELEAIMDAAPAAIFMVHDAACRHMTGNRMAYDLLRRPPGSNLSHSAPEGERPANLRVLKDGVEVPPEELPVQLAAFTGSSLHNQELTFIFPDGELLTLLGSAVPMLCEDGTARGAVGVFVDITSRKRAEEERRRIEEALRESELRLKEAESLARLGSSSYEVATGRSTWSEELYHILGKDPLQPPPGPDEHAALFTPDSWSSLCQALHQTLTAGETCDLDVDVVRTDGTVRNAHVRALPVCDGNGRVVRLQGTLQDITDRRLAEHERTKLQDQLRQAQKLESIGTLAGGVAHDFNNLLTIINGYSGLILQQLTPSDPWKQYMTDILRAGERGAALTRQLLAFSRKTLIEPGALDLNQLISEQYSMLQRLIRGDIEILLDLGTSPGLVFADSNQLHQVLLNLVANARDAMPKGGRVTLRTEAIEFDQASADRHRASPGTYVVLTVSDTGEGMDEEVKERLFEPFFTTKQPGVGTGLGLASVYGIVKQSGGWIDVESQPGKGATFRIGWPRMANRSTAKIAAVPVQDPLAGSETVLVVEDQADVRRFTIEVLKRYGYQVLEASNGTEALTLVARHPEPIHLMLSDIVMPGLSGPELAERIIRLCPKISVLLMSGYPGEVVDARLEYLPKPFSPEALALRVREVLGRNRSLGRVLVADDEEGIRTLFANILSHEGYEVETVENGRQAIQTLSSRSFDLLITDLVMPDKEGIETIQTVHKSHPALKIIAVSGAFGGTFLRAAELLGANATLMKPASPEQLIAAARTVLAN